MTLGVNEMIKTTAELLHHGYTRRSGKSGRSARRATDSDDGSDADTEGDLMTRKMTEGIRHRTASQNKLAVGHSQPSSNLLLIPFCEA
jgi:hypothetical protein